ncbi:MAG TPA: phosphoribosyltransferase family protein [Acidimicrobiales bacterium]|nr:phosphoribosyltransferase family protein [Acidimicrobiales bacterium]
MAKSRASNADRPRHPPFDDRVDAGKQLASVLPGDLVEPIVLGVPRGGVPVASLVAIHLGAPLDVLVARRVGAPSEPELGIAAVAEGGIRAVDAEALRASGVTSTELDRLVDAEEAEVARRVDRYRAGRPLPPVHDRDVVLVDDRLATGLTADTAVQALRRVDAQRVILAVPVCARDVARRLRDQVETLVCVIEAEGIGGVADVGRWYGSAAPTSDDEVVELLQRARARRGDPGPLRLQGD